MKNVLVIIALLISANGFCQNVIGDSVYVSKDSLQFKVGQTITLGIGTMPDGSFKFVKTGPTALVSNMSIGAAYSGLNLFIKKFKTGGNNRLGYKTYLITGGGNVSNYWVDIEMALRSGEVEKESSKPITKK